MRKTILRALLLVGSTVVFLVGAEFLYRWIALDEVTATNLKYRYQLNFLDENREVITGGVAGGFARGLLEKVKPSPRTRYTWKPGVTIYLQYTGIERDFFDEYGSVPCKFNSRGIREREELCEPKPDGQKRILCIGDSFTFGWGVLAEDSWPRLVENILRETDDGVRTVNCGAAGAIFVDEYQWGLEHRFHLFEPDAVLVTLCLNDLLPTNAALAHTQVPPWALRQSRILRDLFQGYALAASLRIDPEHDIVQELLDVPAEFYKLIAPWAPPEAMWASGGAQEALIAMRDWCRERGLPFGVSIWPFFQGLGEDEHYPFTKIHRLVGEFCEANGIPFLDVLPALKGHDTPSLWVSPADYHGNDIAQRLAAGPIAEFLRKLCLTR